MAKKNKQHESVGVDAEVRDLFDNPESEEQEENPFMLPEARKHKSLPVTVENETTSEDSKLDKDVEYARNNIYELIEHGMSAVQDLSHLAREQMHPRTYEVLAQLISNLTKNNVELIELAKTKKEAKKKDINANSQPGQIGEGPTVNNIDKAVFFGSSHDLLQFLKQNDNNNEGSGS